MRLLALILLTALAAGCGGGRETDAGHRVAAGPFAQWTLLRGQVHPAATASVRAELDGLATLTWIIEDGTPVVRGDVLARFDPAALEDRRIGLDRELRMAEAEQRALAEGQHPLELGRLHGELAVALADLDSDRELFADTQALVDEGLISADESRRQQVLVDRALAQTAALSNQVHLTRAVLHPAAAEQALARVEAARDALRRVDAQIAFCELRADRDGTASLPPLPFGNEMRPARVGDGLYKNQVFLEVADLTDLVVRAEIAETDLPRVQPGMAARIAFPALPGLTMEGTVFSVGARPRGAERRYPVELRLAASDERLRPGLSTDLRVLSFQAEDVVQVPRAAVRFGPHGPEVEVGGEIRRVELGPANAEAFVVRDGLRAGERVRLP